MTILENQFGVMWGWSTTDAIFLIRRLMEKYREACKLLHGILREVMWWILEKKGVPIKYIKLIEDMYDEL